MSASNQLSKEAGFTLIEVLIAIVLLAFITFGVVNVTQDALNNKERTTEYNNNTLQIESALSRFEWDLSQIYSPLYYTTPMNLSQTPSQVAPQQPAQPAQPGGIVPQNPNQPTPINPALAVYYEQMLSRFERNEHFVGLSKDGQPIPRFYSPDKTTFEFFTSSNRRKQENIHQSHFAWVRYGLADQEVDPENKPHSEMPASVKSFVRYFSPDDPYNDKRLDIVGTVESRVKGAVLLENVESIEFQFWDLQRRKWENNLRAIQGGETVIRGVKLIITWWDSGGKKTIERVFRPHWPLVAPVDTAPTNTQKPASNGSSQGGGTDGAGEDDDVQ